MSRVERGYCATYIRVVPLYLVVSTYYDDNAQERILYSKNGKKIQKQKATHNHLLHISTAAVNSTKRHCRLRLRSKPPKNFNSAIASRHQPTNQPTNLTYHNLCTSIQPPHNTSRLLGLNLKYCVHTGLPKTNLKTLLINYSTQYARNTCLSKTK